jgi:hypothetical protein
VARAAGRPEGHSFEVSLDDKPVFKATDAQPAAAGTVGVWSQADSVIRFGSLVVAPRLGRPKLSLMAMIRL